MSFDKIAFEKFYQGLTFDEEKKQGFLPYQYQLRVAELLLSGKNVILSVPTGAGKTMASVMPFLFSKLHEEINFPKKMIYSLPLRALCNSIYNDVSEMLLKDGRLAGIAERQTGEFSDDPYFEKDIVFSTIDQTLSNFCCFPLALKPNMSNVNAGALIGSYLVFDEFHLLEPNLSMATTIGMLKMLEGLSRFCIMTATLSDEFMVKVKNELEDVEIVTLDSFDDHKSIRSLQVPKGKISKKKVTVVKGVTDSEIIKQKHRNKSIVICNRVDSAQKVYADLEEWAGQNGVELICLHSRFFDKDRKVKEKRLKEVFGKGKAKKGNAILIATQVVEAGIDISCEVMHCEVAPINALLQRMGRCARYYGEYGEVYIYDVMTIEEKNLVEVNDFENLSDEDKKEIKKLKSRYLPYKEELCRKTFELLSKAEFQNMDEAVATELVNKVLKEKEGEYWEAMEETFFNKNKIKVAWRISADKNENGAKPFYRELIRDIQSVEVVVTDNVELATKIPFAFESVGVFKWSMVKWIKDVFEKHQDRLIDDENEDFWIVGIVKQKDDQFLEWDQQEIRYEFKVLTNIEEVKENYETLFLNPAFFDYSANIGLNNLGRRGNYSVIKEREVKEDEVWVYQKDTFIQHTEGLIGVFLKEFFAGQRFRFAAQAFQKVYGGAIDLKKVVLLILILHDYGKLNDKWQNWMQTYQKALEEFANPPFIYEKNIPLGHTGFETKKDKEEQGRKYADDMKRLENEIKSKRGKRPGHSSIGASAILFEFFNDLIDEDGEELWENLAIPAAYAIARHHGATGEGNRMPFGISDVNYQSMRYLLDKYGFGGLNLKRKGEGKDLDEFIVEEESFIPYLFFVRILRLCDQKATGDFEKYLQALPA